MSLVIMRDAREHKLVVTLNNDGRYGSGPYFRIAGEGVRGGEKASGLFLAHNAAIIRSFARDAGKVLDGVIWHATIGTGSGSLRVKRPDSGDGLEVVFVGARRAQRWQGLFPSRPTHGYAPASMIVATLAQAAEHLNQEGN